MTSSTLVLLSNTSWYLFNFRRSTIQALLDKGWRVICLSPADKYAPQLKELGAEHVALPLDGQSIGPVRELRSLRFILGVLRRIRPAFVFNFTVKLNIYSGLACRWLGIPFANNISGLGTAFIHDSWVFRQVRRVYGRVNRGASHLFFQNEEDLAVFRGRDLLGDTPVTLLPGSGVDLEHFQQRPLPPPEAFTFLMIGRLLGDKGVREYAEAARWLKEKGVDARCVLLGQLGVSNRTAISREEVTEWEQAGVLEYAGETDDVRPFIEQAHVLVLPSYREGMPRTVLEAAAMGRPAIVTDVPGCRQAIVPGETGWLCEVRNAGSLARQMQQVAELPIHELEEYAQAARARMEAEFSEDLVVRAYLDCLRADRPGS